MTRLTGTKILNLEDMIAMQLEFQKLHTPTDASNSLNVSSTMHRHKGRNMD